MKTLAMGLLVLGMAAMGCGTAGARETCAVDSLPRASAGGNPWISKGDWLAPENLRYSLAHVREFMPVIKAAPLAAGNAYRRSLKSLDLEAVMAVDPLDRQNRSVAFLLGSRLYADGVAVVRNGTMVLEDYRHGLSPEQPRMLLSATRPVLAMLSAISTAQGKLRQEKAISRHLPELSSIGELRKISLHRLLNEPAAFQWGGADLDAWKHMSGWNRESPQGSVRSWMTSAPWRLASEGQPGTMNGPEGQLLVWALERAWNQSVPKVFCETLLVPLRAEHPAYWATDGEGDALADGLALSLRDFARLGGSLVEARGSFRGLLPNWFAEGIASSAGSDKLPAYLAGLEKGSQGHYRFISLAGQSRRAALIGSHGTSLFVDFDRGLVIAIFASYPAERSPQMLRTLLTVWEAIASAEKGLSK